MTDIAETLSHVLWIGGATDAGKTSVARLLSERYSWPVYHYDKADLRHLTRLAERVPEIAKFLGQSLDERWLRPPPSELADSAWRTFTHRFPLVLEDLMSLACPPEMRIIAEGYGLTPTLVAPMLRHRSQAIWLFPDAAFKRASMQRRQKGRFGDEVSDPERSTANLLERDENLSQRLKEDATSCGLAFADVDGSKSIEEMATHLMRHFQLAL